MPIERTGPSLLKLAPAKPLKSLGMAGPLAARQTGRLVATLTQPMENWCWATCAAMVAMFLEISDEPDIEEIVVNTLGSPQDVPISFDQMQSMYADGSIGGRVSTKYLDHPLSQFRVDQALEDDMIIKFGVRWDGGGGHVMLITGFAEPDGETIYYDNDPSAAHRRRTVTYDGLIGAFGQGHWSETLSRFKKEKQ